VLASLHVVGTSIDQGETTTASLRWKGAERFRDVYTTAGETFTIDFDHGTSVFGGGLPTRLSGAAIVRRIDTVSPDGVDPLSSFRLVDAWPLLARERAGEHALAAMTVGGRAVLRGTVRLAANDCSGERKGVRTVDLDPATLVPLRVRDVRGGKVVHDLAWTIKRDGAAPLRALHFVDRTDTSDDGFTRRTPAQAAALMALPVAMPTSLPSGMAFAYAGTQPRGGRLGPEASFPKSHGLFAARFSRGIEPLELTIRGAAGTLATDWDESDPYAGECQAMRITKVAVGTATAQYGLPERGMPHLWWRVGGVLYTLSGPYSSAQLVSIANSLQVVPEP
jgi:hypothetical protein